MPQLCTIMYLHWLPSAYVIFESLRFDASAVCVLPLNATAAVNILTTSILKKYAFAFAWRIFDPLWFWSRESHSTRWWLRLQTCTHTRTRSENTCAHTLPNAAREAHANWQLPSYHPGVVNAKTGDSGIGKLGNEANNVPIWQLTEEVPHEIDYRHPFRWEYPGRPTYNSNNKSSAHIH